MPLGYRSVLRLPAGRNAVELAESEFSGWVAWKAQRSRKRVTLSWIDEDAATLWEGCDFTRVNVEHPEDPGRRVRLRLREVNDHGTWTVSVVAIDAGSGGSRSSTLVLEAEVEGPDDVDAVRLVDPPRIVKSILDQVDVRDGQTQVRGTPSLVQESDIEGLLDEILDPDRSVSVIVAASPGEGLDAAWRVVVEDLTRQSIGVATTSIVSSGATELFNASVPERFRVLAGQVRTFSPGVDFSVPADAIRHRILGPATLSRAVSGGRVRGPLPKVHADTARRRLLDLALPSDVRRALELIERQEAEDRRTRAVEARVQQLQDLQPSLSTAEIPVMATRVAIGESSGIAAKIAAALSRVVARWLGPERTSEPVQDIRELDRLLERTNEEAILLKHENDALLERLEHERDAVAQVQQLLDEVQLEAAIAQDDERKWRREAGVLRSRLKSAHLYAETVVESEPTDLQPPQDMRELVARLTPGDQAHPFMTYVLFTGDEDAAFEIDKRDPVGRYASAMWEYVRVLADYSRLKKEDGFAGNVHAYLNSEVDGFKVPVHRHAGTESDSVVRNPLWASERLFPVPPAVDRDSKVHMFAHFKPNHQDTFAPRMHYFDDVDRSGRCYIGYIGRHLTNKQT